MTVSDNVATDTGQRISRHSSSIEGLAICETQVSSLKPWLKPFVKCGQQALSIFTSGMVLSYIGGMIFDHEGTGLWPQLWVNAVSFALLFAIGYGVAWFKNAPWKRRPGVAMAVSE